MSIQVARYPYEVVAALAVGTLFDPRAFICGLFFFVYAYFIEGKVNIKSLSFFIPVFIPLLTISAHDLSTMLYPTHDLEELFKISMSLVNAPLAFFSGVFVDYDNQSIPDWSLGAIMYFALLLEFGVTQRGSDKRITAGLLIAGLVISLPFFYHYDLESNWNPSVMLFSTVVMSGLVSISVITFHRRAGWTKWGFYISGALLALGIAGQIRLNFLML
ncbi:MAG: hypothetical protein KDD25_04075 [Bdellovibrionales bacterium]|nr:hypothetical protein [Bdellovibrionales bacterium]